MSVLKSRRAFTLIELLTVVAIISLLIGILTPAIQGARNQAKKAKTAAMFGTFDRSIENFNTDMNRYPVSSGHNPFEQSRTSSGPFLTGAQWLALQLVGADLRGFVRDELKNDTPSSGSPGNPGPGDGVINYRDWQDWYAVTPMREYTRQSPYVNPDGITSTPELYSKLNSRAGAVPTEMTAGSSLFKNDKVPFFVDALNQPILYYLASPGSKIPYSVNDGVGPNAGVYDQSDNAYIVGNDTREGFIQAQNLPGWDLGSGRPPPPGVPNGNPHKHPMYRLGWDSTGALATQRPARDTFAFATYNPESFDGTRTGAANRGRVWPSNADKYLLISAGRDGWYGTDDDVKNFGR